jgi:hypothetical protein
VERFPITSRYWPVFALLGMLLGYRRNRKDRHELVETSRGLAEAVTARWATTDADTQAMLNLTRQMVRLTWAVVILTVVVLGATLYLGLI